MLYFPFGLEFRHYSSPTLPRYIVSPSSTAAEKYFTSSDPHHDILL